MGSKAKELSALAVQRLTAPGMHAVGGVAGLYLCVSPSGSRSWIARVNVDGKRREMGLGSFPDVSLSIAREKARAARSDTIMGIDPVANRKEARSARQALKATQKTFADCAKAYIEAHSDSWRNAKHRAQWPSTFETYVYPTMGTVMVGEVTQAHVMAVLLPIWKTKTQTATRLRGRIEQVLAWATAAGFRQGENCARWTGLLDQLLPAPGKVSEPRHHPAVRVDDMPAFIKALRQHDGLSPKALEFAVLTAARSGEVRGANWAEIDLEAAVWTVPPERMKAGKEHRVPLRKRTQEILTTIRPFSGKRFIFITGKKDVAMSTMAMAMLLRRMEVTDATVHGMRSTFRTWAGERSGYPFEVCEHALAHRLSDAVAAAYLRSDFFAKRINLMADWEKFCLSECSA